MRAPATCSYSATPYTSSIALKQQKQAGPYHLESTIVWLPLGMESMSLTASAKNSTAF